MRAKNAEVFLFQTQQYIQYSDCSNIDLFTPGSETPGFKNKLL